MTGKQRAMVKERLSDTTASNAEIIKRAGYKITGQGNKGTNTASQIYLENMRNPEIAKKLNDVVEEMEDTLITDVRKFKDSDKLGERTLANDTARWIHDKVKGKSKQITEVHSTGIVLTLDLTSSLNQEDNVAQ